MRMILRLFLVAYFVVFAALTAIAQTYIVTNPVGAVLRAGPQVDAQVLITLPPSTYVQASDWSNSYRKITVVYPDRQVSGFVWAMHISATNNSSPSGFNIQSGLNNLGYPIAKIDGKIGPATKKMIDKYLADHGLPRSTKVEFALQNHILLTFFKREEARRQALDRKRKKEAEMALADSAFKSGACATFATFSDESRRNRSTAQCEAEKRMLLLRSEFDVAIAAQDCTKARELAKGLGTGLTARVNDCEAARKKADLRKKLDVAMAAFDCQAVSRISAELGLSDATTTCLLKRALAAPTARDMYLAAGLFYTEGRTTQARQVYAALIERFPQDDLALQSLDRLSKMRELEIEEQKAADQNKVLEAMRRQTEAATKAAEAARQQAQAQGQQSAGGQFPDGFRPGDGVVLCMSSGNHIPATVVTNPQGTRMELRVERDFFIGNFFWNPKQYFGGQNYYFERDTIAFSASGCN